MAPNHPAVRETKNPVVREDIPSVDRDWIAEYIAQSPSVLHTKHRYATQLAEFAAWLAHERTRTKATGLEDASRPDVVRFRAYLSGGDRYAACHKVKDRTKVLGASAVKNYLSALHSFYEYLALLDIVDRNPTQGVDRPRVNVTPGLRLTKPQLRAFLDARGSEREDTAAYLFAFTAARVSSVHGIRWGDLDLDDEHTVAFMGKGGKHHVVDLHPELRAQLRRYRMHMRALADRDPRIREALSNPETAWVLLTREGKRLANSSIYKMMKRRATRAGLYVEEPAHGECRSKVSPHVLRRTFGTISLNDGQPLDAVADVLNHASVDTTRKHYAFSSNERRKATITSFAV